MSLEPRSLFTYDYKIKLNSMRREAYSRSSSFTGESISIHVYPSPINFLFHEIEDLVASPREAVRGDTMVDGSVLVT